QTSDTYLLQCHASNLADLVVDGAWTTNTFQSLLPEQHTWLIYPNQGISTAGTPGHYLILGAVWNFTGGPAGDDFQFTPHNGQDGFLPGVLDGTNGGTLDYSQDASAISVNLANNSATNLNGGNANGFRHILHVIGNDNATTLVGPDQDWIYWDITGPNQGDLGNVYRQPGSFTFAHVGNLTGSAGGPGFLGRDQFFFSPEFDPASNPVASLSGVLDARGNYNTLDYSSPLVTTGVVVDLSGQDTPTNPSDPFGGLGMASRTAGVRHIQNVVGSRQNDVLIGDDEANALVGHGGTDRLVGNGGNDTFRLDVLQGAGTQVYGGSYNPVTHSHTEEGSDVLWAADVANTWQLTGGDSGTLTSLVNGVNYKASFFDCENLLGGLLGDTFNFHSGVHFTGYINGNRNAGNTFNYTAYAANVKINLGARPSQLASGAGYIVGIQKFIGSVATNTFTPQNIFQGDNQPGTWQITGLDSGTVTYASTAYTFSHFQQLTGGSAPNSFKISNAKSFAGAINGGTSPRNMLDYSAWSTGVMVNLGTSQATGIAGGVSNFNILLGSKQADQLTGGAGIDIIRGNGGTDIITGGSGNDVLIGGSTGASKITSGGARSILIADKGTGVTLNGGSAGCILIGGYTTYDTATIANDSALLDILTEWAGSDPYATRIALIRAGVGMGQFNSLTVHDTSSGDVLNGLANFPADPDWFWAVSRSAINDPDGSSEQLN
ncbi:MAG TPA: hypothetical protein VFA18_19705, partial [Gemmataceae bacterium]|nr:hypothetical protein [Gemmataceae bacterium]